MALVDTRLRRLALAALIALLAVLPRLASPFVLELVTQTALAAVGALALNMLTGLAGQISLGHAGFLCAGAFTVGILTESVKAPPLVTLPADRKSTRLNSSHGYISYAVFCLKKKKKKKENNTTNK